MGQISSAVSTTAKTCASIDCDTHVAQTDILRQYFMERRRALLTELRSIEAILQLDTIPAKVTR